MEKRKGQIGKKPIIYCASVSWGAGSLYMLLGLLEDPLLKLNMVVFVNMGEEFTATLKMRDKLLPVLAKRGIVYKEIDVSEEFAFGMYKRPVESMETGRIRYGYGFCGGPCRWGTGLKLRALNQFYRQELSDYTIVEYIGICACEEERQYRNVQNSFTIKRYPLMDWGITKRQAVQGCYNRGFFYEEESPVPGIDRVYLYEILDNCSCCICRNKNLKELKNIFYLLPQYWDRLKALQEAFPEMPMKGPGKSVFELEKRFIKEGRKVSLLDLVPPSERLVEEIKRDDV